jgi:DNA polymerase (family 10)
MNNTEIARVFKDIASLLDLKGENPFKIRAYQKAARSIEYLPEELERLFKENRLRGIPGVGEAITGKITELVNTGKLAYLEKLQSGLPEGISTLLDIPGIGPRTARLLSTELGVKTIDELEAAIVGGRVARLYHMGDKKAENILYQIHLIKNMKSKERGA